MLPQVVHVDTIGSTNEEGLRLARLGGVGALWIRADVQTGGRGRLGRGWNSPKGNLYASLLLHDPAEMRVLPQLAHVAAVALVEAVRRVLGSEICFALKWPNDLLFGTAKVAGILVEGTQDPGGRSACVLGIGVNCNVHPTGLPYPATDLATACRRAVSVDAMFDALRSAMAQTLALWDQGRNYAAIRAGWLAAALPLGTLIRVGSGPSEVNGAFEGIDLQGRLLVRTLQAVRTIEAGDVVLNDGSAPTPG